MIAQVVNKPTVQPYYLQTLFEDKTVNAPKILVIIPHRTGKRVYNYGNTMSVNNGQF